ncbi:hypothetical protein, partial [Methylomonas koyamae]|uniref:hypothetical protein n=1 Tax=Methylomonas koyamae TaxID=702114 RepID=UPI00210FB332
MTADTIIPGHRRQISAGNGLSGQGSGVQKQHFRGDIVEGDAGAGGIETVSDRCDRIQIIDADRDMA